MRIVRAIRRAPLPFAVFLAVGLLHYLWIGAFPERNAAQARWEALGAQPNTSWLNHYIETQSYWMGYSYALPMAFAAVALRRYRECREQRACAARNVAIGDVTWSGVLAAAGCFLTGCCGSPMLGVYLSYFGASFLPLVKPLIAGITTVMVALSYYWWIWRRSRREIGPARPTACANSEGSGCEQQSPCGYGGCHEDTENAAAAQPRVLNRSLKAERRTTLRVAGMDCSDEVALIEKALRPMEGVREVRANVVGATVTVAHDERVTQRALIDAIGAAGLKAEPAGTRRSGAGGDTHAARRGRWISLGLSAALAIFGLLSQWTVLGSQWLRIALFAGAIVTGGWFIFPKAMAAARRLSPDMNLLMSIAVIGAATIGQWSEAAAVTFLFGLAELLEAFSVQRARRAIESLLDLTPATAMVKRGDSFEELRVEQVEIGGVIAIKSGARVPLDGEVLSGTSAVNQAPITGESMPVEKKAGDDVFAGTINGEGSLEVRVTKPASGTMLARIIHLVEEAQSQKAPSQRFVDVFAKYYTPAVMVLALLVFLVPPLVFGGEWFTWTYRALVLLVIACPCALVISTPVSIVSGLTAMARRGVLIKGGAFLESIGRIRALALDKTGTVTEGRPRVLEVIALNGKSEDEILRIAAGIDAHSNHPLAQAVTAFAKAHGIRFPRSKNYRSRAGRGAEAGIDGHEYFVGNHRFTHELAVCSDELERRLAEIESRAQSVVVVGHQPHADCKGEVLGILAIGDAIRANAAQAIRDIHAAGVGRVVMLSGDNQRTANAIAKEAGIDEAHGDLLPDDKIARIHALLGAHQHVGMIGDGVNDAPAMAAATVGIAMGAAGTDTAIETADIALMQDDLSKVAETIHLGRRTLHVIQFNIALALAIKALFLILALLGHISLWLAILADTGATLLVILNALRLLRKPLE